MQEILVKADIIVAAVGIANFVTAKMIKDNAVIIDVGINRIKLNDKFKLVGDVDFSSVHDKVAAITPSSWRSRADDNCLLNEKYFKSS